MLQTYWTTSWRLTRRIRQDLNSMRRRELVLRRWGFCPGLPNSVRLRSKAAIEIATSGEKTGILACLLLPSLHSYRGAPGQFPGLFTGLLKVILGSSRWSDADRQSCSCHQRVYPSREAGERSTACATWKRAQPRLPECALSAPPSHRRARAQCPVPWRRPKNRKGARQSRACLPTSAAPVSHLRAQAASVPHSPLAALERNARQW